MKLSSTAILALAVLALAITACGAEAGSGAKLPVNKWTRLADSPGASYVWSSPVYVPSREQVLHWGSTHSRTGGRLGFQLGTSRNDVLALDIAKGKWISDYPSDAKAAVGISGVAGRGGMLPSGRPKPSHILQGVCYDSRRKQVIYTMKGLMAAYDPEARTWKDMKARTIMPFPAYEFADGYKIISRKGYRKILPAPPNKYRVGNSINPRKEFSGGPPVYGAGTCYDPVNDEIVMFPHFDAKNVSLREATGQISGHYGTFRYSFKDNTWRLVSDTFGSAKVKAARQSLIAVMTRVSAAMDAAWVLNRHPDAAKAAEIAGQLEAAAAEAAKCHPGAVVKWLKAAAAAMTANKPAAIAGPLRDALWAMNGTLETKLRVEPPPRCAATTVYDSKNQVMVMFGGYTNLARTDLPSRTPNVQDYRTGLNDTWIYDCKTRQWRELPCRKRPPAGSFISKMPMLAFDPESGLVVLVGLHQTGRKASAKRTASLWTLEVSKGEWSKRDEQPWPGGLAAVSSGGGSARPTTPMPRSMCAFDVKKRTLLVIQPRKGGQTTFAMKLDLGKLPSSPAPAWTAPPPIKPLKIPADEAAWIAKLKALPANTWVRARPSREPNRRDWGSLSVDPVRGWVVYFGGGHATYQVNDVAVYAVGANKWVPAAGDFNSFITPQGWEGSTLGYRGGPACGHQRNAYQSFDGRMYVLTGTDERAGVGAIGNTWNHVFHADKDFVRFYDIDRGGVWRDVRIAKFERPDNVPFQTNVHMVDPAGRIINLIRQPVAVQAAKIYRYVYSGRIEKFFTSIYEARENRLLVREVPKPFPALMERESRPYCYLEGQGKVFYMNAKPDAAAKTTDPRKPPMKQVTYLYDTKENKFSELAPRSTPPLAPVQVVEYVKSQKCVLAIIKGQQWVYSFEKNDWKQLPMKVQSGRMSISRPYGQLVWVARYGVFVNLAGGTWIMRPDFGERQK
jgi:galactose oxidase-like protein